MAFTTEATYIFWMMASRVGVENLDSYIQNVHLRVGVAAIVVGLFGALALKGLGVAPVARLAMGPLFFLGAYGIIAGMLKTCPVSAMLGKRRTRSGAEPIVDPGERASLRGRARIAMTLSVALAATASVLLVVAH